MGWCPCRSQLFPAVLREPRGVGPRTPRKPKPTSAHGPAQCLCVTRTCTQSTIGRGHMARRRGGCAVPSTIHSSSALCNSLGCFFLGGGGSNTFALKLVESKVRNPQTQRVGCATCKYSLCLWPAQRICGDMQSRLAAVSTGTRVSSCVTIHPLLCHMSTGTTGGLLRPTLHMGRRGSSALHPYPPPKCPSRERTGGNPEETLCGWLA